MKHLVFLLLFVLVSCGGDGGGGVIGDTVNNPVPTPPVNNDPRVIPILASCDDPEAQFGDEAYPFHARGLLEENIEYYLICSAEQLAAIASSPVYWNRNFALGRSIDLSLYYDSQLSPSNQFMIGTEETPYTGIFYGDNFQIRNFIYNNATGDYAGLFGRINSSNILSIELIDFQINSTNGAPTGALAGRISGSILKNVVVRGGDLRGDNVGGFTGQMDNVTLENSYARIDIDTLDNQSFAGGFASLNSGPSFLRNSFFAGNYLGNSPNFGMLFGVTPTQGGNNDIIYSNVWYDSQSYGACPSSLSCLSMEVQGVDLSSQSDYFFNSNNEPMKSWVFELWRFSPFDYPILDF